MSALQDWSVFADLLGASPDPADAGNWRLLFARRGRVLALPQARGANAEGLDYFVRGGRKRWWAELGLMGCRVHAGLLPIVPLSGGQRAALLRMLCPHGMASRSQADAILAIQFGSRGPLQKVIALGACDGLRTMTKVALRASADDSIRTEAVWLERLAGFPGLATHVPQLAGSGETSSGRAYFTMHALQGSLSRPAFTLAHAALLREMAGIDRKVMPWQNSPLARTISARIKLLETSAENSVRILAAGWLAVNRALIDQTVPTCLSHGDFAAWNLLDTDRGLAAVDWEYAQTGWNPLGDFFHFHLIPAALDGRLAKGRVDRAGLVARAAQHAQNVFGLTEHAAALIAAPLLQTYLIDTVSFYAAASGRIEKDDRVVNSYLGYMAGHA